MIEPHIRTLIGCIPESENARTTAMSEYYPQGYSVTSYLVGSWQW